MIDDTTSELDKKAQKFLRDLNIELGHDYPIENERSFSDIFPKYSITPADSDRPVSERLATAYNLLTEEEKQTAHAIAKRAIILCLGHSDSIRNTSNLMYFFHDIDETLESVNDILPEVLEFKGGGQSRPKLLSKIVGFLSSWGIKIDVSQELWEDVIKNIEPTGMAKLLTYLKENSTPQINLGSICDLALNRIDENTGVLLEFRQSPNELKGLFSRIRSECAGLSGRGKDGSAYLG